MVVKNRRVIVIDKKDLDKYMKKGWELAEQIKEGTWHIAKGSALKGLKKLMQKPIIFGKEGDDAVKAIEKYIGDDELYDDLYDEGKRNPKDDARPLIKAAMKRLGIKESLDEMKKVDDKHEYVEIEIKSDRDVEKVVSWITKNMGQSMEFDDMDTDGIDGGGMGPVAGTMSIQGKDAGKMGGMVQKQFRNKVSVMGESTDYYELLLLGEEVSVKDFDALKKGDTVTIEYKSGMSSGTGTYTITAKNKVAKGKVEKVTMKSTKTPGGVKYFLYKRDNKVGFAQGDMGASVVSFKKEEVELDEVFDFVLLDKDNKIAGRYSGSNAKKDAESGKKSAHLPPMSIPKGDVKKMKIVPIAPKDKKGIGDTVLAIGETFEVGTDEYREYLEKLTPGEGEIDEGKMSQLHMHIKDGKSAKEIAKIMKLDVKTIKTLMGESVAPYMVMSHEEEFIFEHVIDMSDEDFDQLLEDSGDDIEFVEGLGSLLAKGAKLVGKGIKKAALAGTTKAKLDRAKKKGDKLKMKQDLIKQKADNKAAKAQMKQDKIDAKKPKAGDKIKGKDGKDYVVGTDGKATTTPFSSDASQAAKDRAAGKEPAKSDDAKKAPADTKPSSDGAPKPAEGGQGEGGAKPDAPKKPDANKKKKPAGAGGASGKAAGQGSNLTSEFTPEGAAADARRSIARDKDLGRRKDSADDDNDASVADVKAANKNIIQQLKKILDTNRAQDVEFLDKKKKKVDPRMAKAAVAKYMGFKRSSEKGDFQAKLAKSYKDFLMVLKNDYTPQVENTILDRIDNKLQERKNG
jgi:hypothetical protein